MSSVNRSKNVGRTPGSLRSRRQGGSHIRKRPFVVATFAITADGKVTTKNFGPVDFTSCKDKLHLFRQRASADAVLIGHTSLERDNVRLGLPRDLQELRTKRGQSRSPMRVIISNKGRIDERLKIFQSDISPIIVFSSKRMPQKNQKALRTRATLHLTDAEHVDLGMMLETLRDQYKVRTLACEGGPTLFRALLKEDFIDQLNLTIAPHIFGGATAPTLTGLNDKFLPASIHCSLIDVRTLENECFLIYRIKHQRGRRK